MTTYPTWLNLKDLGRIHGISAIHCAKALKKKGWSDDQGKPTPLAFKTGVALKHHSSDLNDEAVWHNEICSKFLQEKRNKQINRNLEIEQWTQLLEALAKGSPSVNATAEQMAEDLPNDLIEEVNNQLQSRGCIFRVQETKKISQCRSQTNEIKSIPLAT